MEVVSLGSPPGGNAGGAQLEDRVERRPAQISVGGRSTYQVVQIVTVPPFGGCFGHDLLQQDVQRRHGGEHGVEPAGPHPHEQRRAFDQLIAGEGKDTAFGGAVAIVARAAHPLQEGGQAAGGTELADEFHRADVDAQLERGGSHQGPQLARAQAGFHAQPTVLGKAAVVGGNGVVAEALLQQVGHAFGHAAGVDEHQGGAMGQHQLGDAIDLIGHLFGAGQGFQLAVGQLDGQIEVPLVARVHDHAGRCATGCFWVVRSGPGAIADQEPGHRLDGFLGGGQADADRALMGDVLQAFKAQGQMGAALVSGQSVDLVDDDGVDMGQHLAATGRGEQQVERLWGGDQQVRGFADDGGARRGGSVPGAHAYPQFGRVDAHAPSRGGDFP